MTIDNRQYLLVLTHLQYDTYIYNTCALSKHIGNMCMRLKNGGNTHIYLYASTVHMYCIYPAILNRK